MVFKRQTSLSLAIRKLTYAPIALVFVSVLSFAQTVQDSEGLEAQSKIENIITHKLQTSIATVLDKDAFTVNVRVNIVAKPIPKEKDAPAAVAKAEAAKPAVDKAEQLPGDLTMGLINAHEIIREYEEEIARMKAREPAAVVAVANKVAGVTPDKTYRVASIFVTVGLSEDLGEEYKVQFETWLKNRIEKDYGKVGTYEVNTIKKAPGLKEAERSRSFFEKLSSLQNFLGLLSLGFFAVLALLISKFLVSKEALAQIRLATEAQAAAIQSAKQESQPALDAAPLMPEPAALTSGGAGATAGNSQQASMNAMLEIRNIRDLTGKVSVLVNEVGSNLSNVFNTWLQTGERGLFKTACMMDALLSIQQDQATRLNISIPDEVKASMIEIFQKMAGLAPDEKRLLLEEVYWDLMTLKSIGDKALDRPFGYIAQLKTDKMQMVLAQQNPAVRALAVLHMTDNVKKKYVDSLPPEGKIELLRESLRTEVIKAEDLETTNETLRYVVKTAAQNAMGEIELGPLLPKLLDTFSVSEEATMLREVTGKLSDKGMRLKLTRPTLAFLDEWPEDRLAVLLKDQPADDMYALIRVIPAFKEIVLKQCAPRVVQIIEDDLKAPDRMKSDERDRHLARLRNRMLRLLNSDALKLKEIFDKSARPAAVEVVETPVEDAA